MDWAQLSPFYLPLYFLILTYPCYLCLFEKWNLVLYWLKVPGSYNRDLTGAMHVNQFTLTVYS
jgi:hypothetical protein